MTYPSPRKRATMSAVYCLLVPLGLVFWMGALYPRHLDLEDRPARNLLNIVLIVHVIGVIPCVVSWAVAFRPFVIQGEKRPHMQGLAKPIQITATIGLCWALLLVLVLGAEWSWGIALVLAWVVPGLAYGLWLQRQMRGASRSRQVRLG